MASEEPIYEYVKGQGWIVTTKNAPPKDWAEQCARICPSCNKTWGFHAGWRCSLAHNNEEEWPIKDRWELVDEFRVPSGNVPFR